MTTAHIITPAMSWADRKATTDAWLAENSGKPKLGRRVNQSWDGDYKPCLFNVAIRDRETIDLAIAAVGRLHGRPPSRSAVVGMALEALREKVNLTAAESEQL